MNVKMLIATISRYLLLSSSSYSLTLWTPPMSGKKILDWLTKCHSYYSLHVSTCSTKWLFVRLMAMGTYLKHKNYVLNKTALGTSLCNCLWYQAYVAQCSSSQRPPSCIYHLTSHRKPARKMSLKSKSVPFSDLSPGLREMLQWRQYAPDADPPDGLVTFTPDPGL